jgi:hypothetical protein
MATMTIVPRTFATAVDRATAAAAPETSKTTSAPDPPVHSSTHATTSVEPGSGVSKPRRWTRARRPGSGSTTATSAPNRAATLAIRLPIGPPPRTTTLSPDFTFPRRTS